MLTSSVLESIDRSVLAWLASVGPDGAPNVSPKEVFAAYGSDTVVIANIASPTSVRNIELNPQVCLSIVDVFVQKGFKLRGQARVVWPAEAGFADMVAPLERITGGLFPISAVIAVRVSSVEMIIAPSYGLVGGTTEASQIASAMKTYGVQPKPPGT